MDGYVSKPLRPEELFATIDDLFAAEAPADVAPVVARSGVESALDGPTLLAGFGGNRKLLGDVIDVFLEDSPNLMAAIRQAADRLDAPALASSAHALKGSIGLFDPAERVSDRAPARTDGGKRRSHRRCGDVCRTRERDRRPARSSLAIFGTSCGAKMNDAGPGLKDRAPPMTTDERGTLELAWNEGSPRPKLEKLEKTKAEWRKLLPPESYSVLFEERTEPSFSSPLDKEKRRGTFVCAACYLPLFTSAAKFDSGTGWPSFYEPIAGRMGTKRDYWLVLPRTEYHCMPVRRAPGPCLQRRPAAHRPAVVQQRRRAQVRPRWRGVAGAENVNVNAGEYETTQDCTSPGAGWCGIVCRRHHGRRATAACRDRRTSRAARPAGQHPRI